MFAEMAARAIEEDNFEQVVADLPFFMNTGALWEKAVKLFPQVSSLLIKRNDDTFAVFPFVPNDAACMSLAAVKLLKDWGRDIELRCIDDSHIIHYPRESLVQPVIRMRDDQFVFTEGLDEYYNAMYAQLESSLSEVTEDQRLFNEYRAILVSERIKGCMAGGKKTLFVCEYRLWWQIQKTLNASHPKPVHYYAQKWKDVQAAHVLSDPIDLWKRGAMDDSTTIVKQFYDRFQSASLKTFDKLDEIAALIKNHFKVESQRRRGCSSIRKTILFYQYLQNRVAADLRITPLVIRHLYDSAHSCIGRQYAKTLAVKCLEYPYSGQDSVQRFIVIGQNSVTMGTEGFDIPHSAKRLFLYTGTDQYSYDHFHDDLSWAVDRNTMLDDFFNNLSDSEKNGLSNYTGFKWEIRRDFKLIESVCSDARERIMREQYKEKNMRSWGSMGDGIEWKATIASRASGEDSVYIRKRSMNRNNGKKLNEFTPVIFIFTDDMKGHVVKHLEEGNEAYHYYASEEKDFIDFRKMKVDCVHYALMTYPEEKVVYPKHIFRCDLSSLALMYTRGLLKEQRFKQLIKRPERYLCRTFPQLDTEIKNFPLSEIGVAWGLKYAEESVLVIAKDGWRSSEELAEFAENKKTRIMHQPLSRFSPDVIERLRKLYLISTDLEYHPGRDSIVKRFVD